VIKLCKQLVSEKEFGRPGSSYFSEGNLCKKLQMKVYFAEFSSAIKPITEWKRKGKKPAPLEIISKFLEWVLCSCYSTPGLKTEIQTFAGDAWMKPWMH